jgi:hypothetical protein
VAGGKRGDLVEEEELGEAARLEKGMATPAPELELAGDPAASVIASADLTLSVVQAAPVAVHEAPLGGRDERAQWGDAIGERHPQTR